MLPLLRSSGRSSRQPDPTSPLLVRSAWRSDARAGSRRPTQTCLRCRTASRRRLHEPCSARGTGLWPTACLPENWLAAGPKRRSAPARPGRGLPFWIGLRRAANARRMSRAGGASWQLSGWPFSKRPRVSEAEAPADDGDVARELCNRPGGGAPAPPSDDRSVTNPIVPAPRAG